MATLEEARSAKRKAAAHLARLPQVNGIGLARTRNGYCVKVSLTEAVSPGLIPEAVDGVPLRAEVVGRPRRHQRG
jgi:hypothetical protein